MVVMVRGAAERGLRVQELLEAVMLVETLEEAVDQRAPFQSCGWRNK